MVHTTTILKKNGGKKYILVVIIYELLVKLKEIIKTTLIDSEEILISFERL